MPSMFDITRACELQNQQNSCAPVNYNKVVTGGNDPSITKAMRYSQYVRNSKPRTEYSSDAAARLAQQGITFKSFFSPILVSLQFTNLKEFNMPREKVFSRTNVR
jgi:phospholipase/lecithinase/hemolysin